MESRYAFASSSVLLIEMLRSLYKWLITFQDLAEKIETTRKIRALISFWVARAKRIVPCHRSKEDPNLTSRDKKIAN